MDTKPTIMVDVNDLGFLDNTETRTGTFVRPVDTALMLRDCYWIEFELSRMAMGWVTAAPDWEWKGELVRMGYLHTEHMKKLRERIGELPGAALNERSWTPQRVSDVFLAVSTAPAFAEFAYAYRSFVTKLYARYAWLSDVLDPILEEPTLDALRVIELDRQLMIGWADPHVRFAYVDDPEGRKRFDSWRKYADRMWDELASDQEHAAIEWAERLQHPPAGPVPASPANDPKYPHVDLTKYRSAMFDPASPTYDSVKHMIFINASEMSATESLTYLYYGVQKMPMDFYHDVARHTWDESRHSRMGVRRLKQLGYRTEDFSWHPSTALTPDNLERTFPEFYSTLTMVMEPCSFIKKRKSIDAFKHHGDDLSSLQSEYDIADERLHVQFGKKWGAKLFEQIEDFVTAQSVADKAKQLHLQKMGYSQSEIDSVLRSFPEFCGFATMDLKYDVY
ncbi:Protein of unknown function [Paenibacillus sp. UNCCL117]|uniref:DUF455 family protein n=1 Tax=unclassified Paenibacillus TaxID=185978 RepID=UPI000884B6A3|nr:MULTISPECIES: DUF455 family protein [unclassified Paenibacillus]SDC28394.1 Protein of unknown function [Paenibacillus sp. cl123]SFW20544.1 Protein of unknown function [Paenibacillus sp. UNCCL117]